MTAKKTFESLKTVLDLIRVRNAVISFFGVYVGALVFLLESPMDTFQVLKAAIAAALILGGGNALNDYYDYRIDRINQPKRPIPSGRITRNGALILALAMYLFGLTVSYTINAYCLALAGANTLLLTVYARYGKRMLLTSNMTISYLVASVFIFGALSAYTPAWQLNPGGVKLTLVLTVCSFLINLSREIIKDIEDVEGDRKAKSLTLPIKYGEGNAKNLAIASALATCVISLTPIASPTPGFNGPVYGAVIVLTDLVLLSSFGKPPKAGQKRLVTGMTLALIAFLLGAAA